MGSKTDQHVVGIPAKRRGQQTGFAGNPDQNLIAEAETPALRGKRPKANKMYADVSSQNISTNSVTPRTNSPSTPAMDTPQEGDSGGERTFKQRLARKRADTQ
jgi:hypothetical protein